MAEGNWAVGIIVDEATGPEQRDAIAAIASGQAGGPMEAVSPLIGKILGVEAMPIRFEVDGFTRRITIPGVLEMEVEGMTNPNAPDTLMYLDNIAHPVNGRLALARAPRSTMNVFGYQLEDSGGRTNGHFTSFAWAA